ncbi:hypothetical protein [Streptomyces sp. AK02-01A]|uniref:hypothetical protein n=1 Tax=Streptomyces sp. AK02-01A TaxID=3028648 RepID=UPI0029AA76A8|nr:hypothetical protein [Streptomyces sp. AK02-01A]MDX3855629.1 hypothetical protein [Streptomyces sp. AK02-01A]
MRHNDTLDRLLRAGSQSEPDAHIASAQRLVSATRTALKAVTDERPGPELTATQHTALWEIACGHVVATSSLGRRYVHYRDERVLIGTLRSLEANGLTEHVPKSASSAYVGGPLQDRIRITAAGTTALAAAISRPPTTRAPGTTPAPAPAKAATRNR